VKGTDWEKPFTAEVRGDAENNGNNGNNGKNGKSGKSFTAEAQRLAEKRRDDQETKKRRKRRLNPSFFRTTARQGPPKAVAFRSSLRFSAGLCVSAVKDLPAFLCVSADLCGERPSRTPLRLRGPLR
jgi:hypothetical protein